MPRRHLAEGHSRSTATRLSNPVDTHSVHSLTETFRFHKTGKNPFYLKSEHPTSVRLLIFSENNKGGILNKLVDVSPQWTNVSVTFNLPKADAGYALQLPRLMLNYGGENTYYLSPVALSGEDE